jgi:hypothetical protein
MLLANCQMSAPLEHKGHFPLSLENQFANSIYPGLTSHRAEVASNLFTVFHADTSHERQFLQVLHGQFLCFALIFPRSPQNSCRFDPIYYLHFQQAGTLKLGESQKPYPLVM